MDNLARGGGAVGQDNEVKCLRLASSLFRFQALFKPPSSQNTVVLLARPDPFLSPTLFVVCKPHEPCQNTRDSVVAILGNTIYQMHCFQSSSVTHKPARLRGSARAGTGAQKTRDNAEWGTLFNTLREEGSDTGTPDDNGDDSTRKDGDKMELYLLIANPMWDLACVLCLLEQRCAEAKHWMEKVVEVEMEHDKWREALGQELDMMRRQLDSAQSGLGVSCYARSKLLLKAETLILQSILHPRMLREAETMPVQILPFARASTAVRDYAGTNV
ncbi:hypothetical protein B0H17DRAFT_1128851 [Mycena rosella]|uniref:Uncharacterized protein n=1 Tax=Mycena rosella TaxID=1033263 RepID=A0AAD7DV34_MYCRO|nr:hypothetical protein B0H17DRAFT_1128851 [Mycena rosella]